MGVGCERARHLQPLAFEQRQCASESVGALDQMQAIENFRAGRGGGALGHTPAMHRSHQQILEHGEILERPRNLIGASDSGDAALDAAWQR